MASRLRRKNRIEKTKKQDLESRGEEICRTAACAGWVREVGQGRSETLI